LIPIVVFPEVPELSLLHSLHFSGALLNLGLRYSLLPRRAVHFFTASLAPALQIAHVLGQLLAWLEPNVRLLPIRLEPGVPTAAAFLAQHV
jgi:hypothetical protein